MIRSLSFASLSVASLFAVAAGCGSPLAGGSNDGFDPIPNAPTQSSDVVSVYEQIGNSCNDGQLTRGLSVKEGLDVNTLWSTPPGDGAWFSATRAKTGWGGLLAVGELDYAGFSENFQLTSAEQVARCGAARELFSPSARDGRVHFVNFLLYAGDHPHTDRWPIFGGLPDPVAAPARLTGYISLASAVRQDQPDGSVVYADAEEQHLPIQIHCDNPLRVTHSVREVTTGEAASIDPATCETDEKGTRCLFESLEHVADNRCTFVAVDANYKSADGRERPFSLGGRIETLASGSAYDPVRYRLTIDRFAFHAAR